MLIKSTGQKIGESGIGCWVKDNKMNIKGVLMGSGTAAALNDVDIEGNISISGTSFSRWADDDHWEVIRNFMVPAVDDDGNLILVNGQPIFVNALENDVPFLTVTYGGQSYTLWSDGEKLYDLNMRELTPTTVYSDTVNPPTEGYNHALIYQAFTQAQDIVLTQGGLSVILQFYH